MIDNPQLAYDWLEDCPNDDKALKAFYDFVWGERREIMRGLILEFVDGQGRRLFDEYINDREGDV